MNQSPDYFNDYVWPRVLEECEIYEKKQLRIRESRDFAVMLAISVALIVVSVAALASFLIYINSIPHHYSGPGVPYT